MQQKNSVSTLWGVGGRGAGFCDIPSVPDDVLYRTLENQIHMNCSWQILLAGMNGVYETMNRGINPAGHTIVIWIGAR